MTRQVGSDDAMFNDLAQTLQRLLLLNGCYWTRWNYPILYHRIGANVGNISAQ